MSGGWFGYVYVFFGCGAAVAVVAFSTLLIYGWARLTRGRGAEPRVTVTRLSSRDESSAG